MRNYIEMDSTPLDEACLNVGEDTALQKFEASVMKRQIERTFKSIPDGFYIKVNRNFHDFGIYFDLQLCYVEGTDEVESPSEEFTYELESNWPTNWDELSKNELHSRGYFEALEAQKKPNFQQFTGTW
ncbi:MAG: hypothetical protein RIB01_15345 [Balneola sp.]